MKIIKIIISTLFISATAYSQGKLSLSLSAAPVLSNSYLQTDKKSSIVTGNLTYNDLINGLNNHNKSSIGFKIHLGISYNLTEKLNFNSGLFYM